MSKKVEGELGRIGAILLWVILLFLWAHYDLWYLFVACLALHLAETVLVGVKKGTAAGYSPVDSFLYTLIFGFTWWKYLEE
ncbi:MAG TPA: hypothetical protein PKO38_08255 [Bacillota bacterium]|jgi:hypothetical protein|nr:hypothetical protein [Bacillota bacterium]HOB87666.1 hypothetical protein [Bacillota bacterium]HOP68916.1 hypothetical protein [Bacillota bacterium]HPT33423.1 hypothetical protein [Bacillota bacterium]HQD05373.1 hypothetical protein [Bacillota bacterium]